MNEQCNNCKYYRDSTEFELDYVAKQYENAGKCRKESIKADGFPFTLPDDWCGEWKGSYNVNQQPFDPLVTDECGTYRFKGKDMMMNLKGERYIVIDGEEVFVEFGVRVKS